MGNSMNNRYVVLRENVVENIVAWDGISEWAPPHGTTAQPLLTFASIGWIMQDNGSFVAPPIAPAPAEDPLKISARNKLTALGLTEDEIKALLG
jgi:hypothetical protein